MAPGKSILKLRVGKVSYEEAGKDFIAAWRRAEAGDTRPETIFQFEDWNLIRKALSPKRMELLNHVRRNPVSTTAALARMLKRDARNVHDDVAILIEVGLLEKTETGLVAPFSSIELQLQAT
ncbi:hypothetical protein [Ferrovibrio sp.]|uniref:HVO_A0114 family putative DNA-binding protein n=1 Tax=Ferrovibrio sp. TaxID=1917215 RepID=UPI0025B9E57D|nr:hypothetical protein [Ferrovibrio sp.]MBX3455956.1 hypothetical protein [Ferrovibrio sp.]